MFAPALEGFKTVKSDGGEILTKPFLEVCKQILPVIGSSLLSSLFCFDPRNGFNLFDSKTLNQFSVFTMHACRLYMIFKHNVSYPFVIFTIRALCFGSGHDPLT